MIGQNLVVLVVEDLTLHFQDDAAAAWQQFRICLI